MQKKRKTSSERYKQRIRQRRIFVLSVFAAVILLCICLFTPIFGITQISVTGNTLLAAEDVIVISGIEKGENVFRINKKKTENALAAEAYIEAAKIKRKFPAKIVIEIDEAKHDIIIDTPQEFIVTTIAGRVLKKTDDVSDLASPIIYGIDVTQSELAAKIETEDDAVLNMNLERIGCFYETEYWDDIDEFYVSDVSNFVVIMKSGMKITFGSIDSNESLQRKIKMMTQILPQVQQSEKSYLDLTTDKGYFGEYTDAELKEIQNTEKERNIGQTDESDKQPEEKSDTESKRSNDDEDEAASDNSEAAKKSAKPSSSAKSSKTDDDEDEASARKKSSADQKAAASKSPSAEPTSDLNNSKASSNADAKSTSSAKTENSD